MAAYTGTPITDPDQLAYEVDVAFASAVEEIVINTTAKTIALKVTGNLGTDGATIKAVYSKLKDAWRVNSTLIKFPFPMGPITDEQFEMLNGWNWDKVETSGAATQTTVELLRTGGWSVVDVGATFPKELWTSVVTLGSLGSTDQVYYQQVNAAEASVNFKLTGPVNQAIQILSDPNSDGNTADGYSKLTYLKLFVREWQKLYAQSEIADIGVSTLTYQAYRYPLTNSSDLKITVTAANITAQLDSGYPGSPSQATMLGVYGNVTVTYLRDSNNNFYNVLGAYNPASFAYVIGDVVQDTGNQRWYKNIVGYTSDATQPSANATNWAAYEGERQIGSNYYAFTVIVDADDTVGPTASGAARIAEIYTAVQYLLKLNADIDEDATGTVTGKTASSLLRFVGDTMITADGVYVDSFNSQDTNSITFTDALGSAWTFPYVAALTVNFGTNLQNDQYAKYWVFFTNDNAADTPTGKNFGTTAAVIVEDNSTIPMTGDVNPAWPTKRAAVSHTFNYDGNVQRGAGSASKDAPITVVGIGLTTGQYVSATGTIAKSTANAVTLTSSLERNYSQGTTYP